MPKCLGHQFEWGFPYLIMACLVRYTSQRNQSDIFLELLERNDHFLIFWNTWLPFGNDLSILYQDWELFWAATSSCIFQTADSISPSMHTSRDQGPCIAFWDFLFNRKILVPLFLWQCFVIFLQWDKSNLHSVSCEGQTNQCNIVLRGHFKNPSPGNCPLGGFPPPPGPSRTTFSRKVNGKGRKRRFLRNKHRFRTNS